MADIYTDAGEEFTVDQLDAFGNYYVAWGTGAGTAAKADTTLFVESAESRVITTDTQPAANQLQWVGTLTSASSQTITNAGIFDAATLGNVIVKSDFTGVVLANGDKIEFTFQLTFS